MNEATRYEVWTSAVGFVLANPAADAAAVSQWIRNVGWAGENIHGSTALAIATRAVQAVRVAGELNDDPFRVPTLGQLPSNVGVQPDDPRVVYQVVLIATDAAGETVSTRIDLQLDGPVSFATARDLAIQELAQQGTRGKREVREALRADPLQAPEVRIVAVGKR